MYLRCVGYILEIYMKKRDNDHNLVIQKYLECNVLDNIGQVFTKKQKDELLSQGVQKHRISDITYEINNHINKHDITCTGDVFKYYQRECMDPKISIKDHSNKIIDLIKDQHVCELNNWT